MIASQFTSEENYCLNLAPYRHGIPDGAQKRSTMKKYPNLLSPINIKSMALRNRVVMPPIGTNFAGLGGEMTDDHMAYYSQRARGGTALITLENVCIDYPSGTNGTTQVRFDDDQYLPGMFKFTEAMHAHGAAVSVQLNHAGASASPLRMKEQVVSSSNIPSKTGGNIPRPLKVYEIYRIVEKFSEAADRAKRAGFDCVEIHAGHSYLLSQFLSPVYNRRTDEFGGSLENRARFPQMVVRAVRSVLGPMYPIGLRISADELQEGGNKLDDSLRILEYLVDEVDILNVSAALNDSLQYQIDQMSLADGWRSFMAAEVREKFGKITMTTGNIRNPEVAERILAEGQADLIGMGRGLIAEPYWVDKTATGREHLLRKCISCNIGCADHRIGRARPIRCTINPDLFTEAAHKKIKIDFKPKVLVIGGGTAGLEAAATAAEMGCPVKLMEQGDHLGGLAAEICKIPEKKRIRDFVDYQSNRIKGLNNLEVRLNTVADLAAIRAEKPDLIVAATGSNPLLPPISGLKEELAREGGRVHSITKFLASIEKFRDASQKVVVVGGGAVGLDVVEYYFNLGARDITVVEMMPSIARDVDFISKIALKDMLSGPDAPKVLTSAVLKEVRADHFVVEKEGERLELPFDQGFVCLGMAANKLLAEELAAYCDESGARLLSIGDRKQARRIIDGVREGRELISNTITLMDELRMAC